MAPDGSPTRFEPPISDESVPFWEATREQRLVIQWCTACDHGVFYPRAICPGCGTGAETVQWREASGQGVVHALTVEHHPATTGATFAAGEPYAIALVDLSEGVRMMSNVVGAPLPSLHIGMAVHVTWEPLSDGRHLPLFTPDA
jgi:hypothetical protein